MTLLRDLLVYSFGSSIRGSVLSAAKSILRGVAYSAVVCVNFSDTGLAQESESQTDHTVSFPEQLDELNRSYTKLLKSGTCKGQLTIMHRAFNEDVASQIADCDFQMVFKGDKIRLQRQYRDNQLTSKHQRGSWGIEAKGCVQQTLISNGAKNYWARFDEAGKATCQVLKRPWCDKVLSNLDAPSPHPIRIWENTPPVFRNSDLKYKLTPLKSGGFLARGRADRWSIECYLLAPEPLRLNRFSIKAAGELNSEHHFQWSESLGVPYVESYSKHWVFHEAPRRKSETWLSVRFTDFVANSVVDDHQFTIASLGVPRGTEFRANAPVPTSYVFDGKNLVRNRNK